MQVTNEEGWHLRVSGQDVKGFFVLVCCVLVSCAVLCVTNQHIVLCCAALCAGVQQA